MLIAAKIGCTPQTPNDWVKQAEVDSGRRAGIPVLPIAPSTYYDHLAKRADPSRLSGRACQDEALRPEILRVFEEN